MMLPGVKARVVLISIALALAASSPRAASPASDTFLDFDASPPPDLLAACGGATADWETLRAIADPRDGFVRSRAVARTTCLLVKGTLLGDGIASARIRLARGIAGFALRHRADDTYISVAIDREAKKATATIVGATGSTELVSATIDAIPGDDIEITVALHGPHLALFLGGRRILDTSGAPIGEGEIGLLAGARASVEFDDVEIWSPRDSPFPVILPAALPPVHAGRSVNLDLSCETEKAVENGSSDLCRFRRAEGAPPAGIRLQESGSLAGMADLPGVYRFVVEARELEEGGAAAHRAIRMRVNGTRWPRFPLDADSHQEPVLAALYTPDDIGQNFNLKKIGEPDIWLFRMHKDHPNLRVALMSCPASRYIGERPLGEFPEVAALWKSLALGTPFDWIEIGGHGYTHSPEGDTNLDHHEFSTKNTGCNIDHARMADPEYCKRHMTLAREAYRAAGIPDDRVVVMRFPGVVDNPEAIRAALDAGFLAIFGRRHLDETGREWWIPGAGGTEILEIEDSHLQTVFARSEKLEKDLEEGRVTPADVTQNDDFKRAVRRGADYLDRVAAGGGILNFSNHYWETFAKIGGTEPRYLILDAVLHDMEKLYAGRIWYPTARDLALWLEARRSASVTWRARKDGVHVAIEPPTAWKRIGLTGISAASLVVTLPAEWKEAGTVEIKEEGGAWRTIDPARSWMTSEGLAVTFPLRGAVELRIARGGG